MKNILLLFALIFSMGNVYAQWEQLKDAPFVRHHSNAFGWEGKAYVIGGVGNSTGNSSEVWRYDPTDESWTRMGDFPGTRRGFAIGEFMDGKYYYGFGTSNGGLLNDVWEYDPATDNFTQLPSCPCSGRTHPAFVAHENKLFLGAGGGSTNDLNDFWVYDFTTSAWSQKANVPGEVRHHPFQFGIDSMIFVGGGHRTNWAGFNINTETWSDIDNYPQGRVAGQQFDYNGKGYAISGENRFHQNISGEDLFLEYDPVDDVWNVLPPHPGQTRWSPTTFIIDDYLYFFGGLSRFESEDEDFTMWRFNIGKLDCIAPTALNATAITDDGAGLFWFANDNSLTDLLQWRKVGESDWNDVPDVSPVYTLDGLEPCEDYEFQVVSACESIVSDYSQIFGFSTAGCCTRPDINFVYANGAVSAEWNNIQAAADYDIRWRAIGTTTWETGNTTGSSFDILGLDACSEYEIQLKPNCSTQTIDFSESLTFWSYDCGPCIEEGYCPASTAFAAEGVYIEEIQINDYVNTSGANGGLGNFVMPDAQELLIGASFELAITPGFTNGTVFSNYSMWLDYNGDGNFTTNEKLLYATSQIGKVTRQIDVPAFAKEGTTRMRIIVGAPEFIGACNDPSSAVGELEDYCVNLVITSSVDNDLILDNIAVHPNPFDEYLNIEYKLERSIPNATIEILDILGQVVYTENIDLLASQNNITLAPNNIQDGVCVLQIMNSEGEILFADKVFSLNKN